MDGSVGWAVSVRTPLATVHGCTPCVGSYIELMYHSCSPLPGSEEPLPLGSAKMNVVAHVPDWPFHRLSELNSSSKVRCAVAPRFVGSMDMRPPVLAARLRRQPLAPTRGHYSK